MGRVRRKRTKKRRPQAVYRGRPQGGHTDVARAVGLVRPQSPEALTAIVTALNRDAAVLAGRNALDEAARMLHQALDLAPAAAMTHQNLGAVALMRHDHAEAKRWLSRAVSLDPRSVTAHFNLAQALRGLGDFAGSVPHLERVLALDPAHHSAEHLLAASRGDAPDAPSIDYVATLFDQFATTFDDKMVNLLDYRAPTILREVLRDSGGARPLPDRFARALDAGCGTGLSGEAFRAVCAGMTGVDISSGMLARARERAIYDDLVRAEICAFLAATEQRFDLIIASDSLNYLGKLEPVMTGFARCAQPGARIVFSTESGADDDFALTKKGRYTHHRAYVERVGEQAGLRLVLYRSDTLRRERREPVGGDFFCFIADA